MNRAVFFDLNGTLVLPIKFGSLSELELIPGAGEAVARLCQAGFICPVVTVQSGIAKGVFSQHEFLNWFGHFMLKMGAYAARLEGPYVCPHRFAKPCPCKKPNTLLYEQAAADHKIDLEHSFVVGDSASDVCAAYRFKGKGCLVKTGWATNQSE